MRRAFLPALAFAFAGAASTSPALAQTTLPQVAPPQAAVIQNPDRTFTPGADYDTIVERGWIEFGVYEDFPPYSWERDGELAGLDIELGLIIAEGLGVEPRFRALAAGETVDADLRHWVWKGPLIGPTRNVVNVMLHVPFDRELDIRNELVVLTGKYMIEELAIAYRRDAYPGDPPLPGHFLRKVVGVENDSLADFYLSRAANGRLLAQMRRYRDAAAAVAAMKAGEVTAVLGPKSQLEFALSGDVEDVLDMHTPPLPGLARGRWTLGVALRHNYRQLGYAVDDAIGAALADGRLAAAFKKFGVSLTAPKR